MFSTFSVHYPSITEYKFVRIATDAYHLYETPVTCVLTTPVGAASQWWWNERMMVYFKVMMVKCLLMMVKYQSMMVKWVYDYILISPSLMSISPSLTSISPSFTSILPSLFWSKPFHHHWEAASTDILYRDYSSCYSLLCKFIQHISSLSKDRYNKFITSFRSLGDSSPV